MKLILKNITLIGASLLILGACETITDAVSGEKAVTSTPKTHKKTAPPADISKATKTINLVEYTCFEGLTTEEEAQTYIWTLLYGYHTGVTNNTNRPISDAESVIKETISACENNPNAAIVPLMAALDKG